MPVDLEALRKLLGEATPGEYKFVNGGPLNIINPQTGEKDLPDMPNHLRAVWFDEQKRRCTRILCEQIDEADATLIVTVINALPSLLSELESLRAVAEAAKQVNKVLQHPRLSIIGTKPAVYVREARVALAAALDALEGGE